MTQSASVVQPTRGSSVLFEGDVGTGVGVVMGLAGWKGFLVQGFTPSGQVSFGGILLGASAASLHDYKQSESRMI